MYGEDEYKVTDFVQRTDDEILLPDDLMDE